MTSGRLVQSVPHVRHFPFRGEFPFPGTNQQKLQYDKILEVNTYRYYRWRSRSDSWGGSKQVRPQPHDSLTTMATQKEDKRHVAEAEMDIREMERLTLPEKRDSDAKCLD